MSGRKHRDSKDDTEREELRRAIPLERRRAFAKQFVKFHIEELNALYDRLRWQRGQNDEAGAEASRVKISVITEVLEWNRDEAVRYALEHPIDQIYPEDCFGPALILGRLCDQDDQIADWLDRLPPEARAWVAERAKEVPARVVQLLSRLPDRAASRRARRGARPRVR